MPVSTQGLFGRVQIGPEQGGDAIYITMLAPTPVLSHMTFSSSRTNDPFGSGHLSAFLVHQLPNLLR